MIVFLAAPMSMQLHLQDFWLASCGVGLDMGIDNSRICYMCYSRVIYISRAFLFFFSFSPLFFLLSFFVLLLFFKKENLIMRSLMIKYT
jgi:hypothetical protein